MNVTNKKVLLLASSIILISNETHATKNNGKTSTAENTTQTTLSSTSKHKTSETSKALAYLKSLQFEPEGRFCPSFTHRTGVLANLRKNEWTLPADNQLLVSTLQTFDYAIQECTHDKYNRLAELITLCFEKNVIPNQTGLKIAHGALTQRIDAKLGELRMLVATQLLIQEMSKSSESFSTNNDHPSLKWLRSIL